MTSIVARAIRRHLLHRTFAIDPTLDYWLTTVTCLFSQESGLRSGRVMPSTFWLVRKPQMVAHHLDNVTTMQSCFGCHCWCNFRVPSTQVDEKWNIPHWRFPVNIWCIVTSPQEPRSIITQDYIRSRIRTLPQKHNTSTKDYIKNKTVREQSNLNTMTLIRRVRDLDRCICWAIYHNTGIQSIRNIIIYGPRNERNARGCI